MNFWGKPFFFFFKATKYHLTGFLFCCLKICTLCIVLLNNILFYFLCVWILFWNTSSQPYYKKKNSNKNTAWWEGMCVWVCLCICILDGEGSRVFASTTLTWYGWPCFWLGTVIIWPVSINCFHHLIVSNWVFYIQSTFVVISGQTTLSPFLTGRMFVCPNILWTLRRTMIHFLIELLVRPIWFRQSKLYFILNWLVMRCKLRPELAADAQQTAWSKM